MIVVRIYRRKQSKRRGRKFGTGNAKRVKKMGAVTKFFDLRPLKVRLCADDLSFAQMAVEARRKAVTNLGPTPSLHEILELVAFVYSPRFEYCPA